MQDFVHDCLKSGWGVAQAELHHQEFKQSLMQQSLMRAKSCLLHIGGMHQHLMVPRSHVELGEECHPTELV
jgi:hypothetical protein